VGNKEDGSRAHKIEGLIWTLCARFSSNPAPSLVLRDHWPPWFTRSFNFFLP